MTLSSNRIIKLKAPIKKLAVLSEAGGDGCTLSEIERELAGEAAEPQVEMISFPKQDFEREIEFAFQKGIEDGKLQGYQQAEADYAQKVNNLMNISESFQIQKEQFFKDSESILLNLAVNIVKKIIVELPQQIPGFIKKSIAQVLGLLSSEPVVEVFMHPQDIENYDNLREVFEIRLPNLDKLVIKPDDRIQRGGCIISTDTGKIDARVQTQADKLIQEIQKSISEVSSEEIQ